MHLGYPLLGVALPKSLLGALWWMGLPYSKGAKIKETGGQTAETTAETDLDSMKELCAEALFPGYSVEVRSARSLSRSHVATFRETL